MHMDEIKSLSTEKLEELQNEITQSIIEIRAQVDAAKAEAAKSGVYANSDWYIRAKSALAYQGRDHQMILTELAKRRKDERAAKNDLVTERFILACKRRLDPGLLESLWEEAKDGNA